jgi:hypothetical protein
VLLAALLHLALFLWPKRPCRYSDRMLLVDDSIGTSENASETGIDDGMSELVKVDWLMIPRLAIISVSTVLLCILGWKYGRLVLLESNHPRRANKYVK